MARILGLDIGEHSVRGVLVRTTMRKIEVLRYVEVGLAPMPPPTPPAEPELAPDGEEPVRILPDPEPQETPLRLSMTGLLGSLGQNADRIVTSVDGREASLRIVDLPIGAKKRIAEVLPFELESIIPFDPDESVVDHQLAHQSATELKVLACAIPKQHVEAHLNTMRAVGVEPREVAVGAAALDGLSALIPALEVPGPILLVEIGDDSADVCVLARGKTQLARTLSAGVTQPQALASQLRHTLMTWRASGGEEMVQALVLGSASGEDAVAWLSHELGLEVRPLPLPPAEGADGGGLGRYGRAAALACRTGLKDKRIDLRKGDLAFTQTMGALRQYTRLGAACASIVLVAFLFATFAKWLTLDAEREALREELAEVTEDAFDQATKSPSRARRMLREGTGGDDPLPRFDAYDTLDAISANLPAEITHSTRRLQIELEEDGHSGTLELRGVVASVAERDRIAEALESHECISDIEKGSTSAGPGGEGLSYQLRADVRCPGAPEPEPRSSRRRSRR